MQTEWIASKSVQRLLHAYTSHGVVLRFVGGCVRDAVLGRAITDIDLATPALPERVMEIAKKENLKAIPTGIEHGTVSIVIDSRLFEVTTLRQDVACDGRHAEVAYTDDWQADASRRDFTMNALSMDAQGHITDFFGGVKDAKAGRVKFIGDAGQRIQEDGLRILRFFRFLATHGQGEADQDALVACEHYRHMLDNLSGERIHKEMMKLFSADNPLHALKAGQSIHIWNAVLMSDAPDIKALEMLINYENTGDIALDPLLRIVLSVKRDKHAVHALVARWKCSNREKKMLGSYVDAPLIDIDMSEQEQKKRIRRLGAELFVTSVVMSAISQQHDIRKYEAMFTLAKTWPIPHFPLRGADLKALGFDDGPVLGDTLRALEEVWESSNYHSSKDELLEKAKTLSSQ